MQLYWAQEHVRSYVRTHTTSVVMGNSEITQKISDEISHRRRKHFHDQKQVFRISCEISGAISQKTLHDISHRLSGPHHDEYFFPNNDTSMIICPPLPQSSSETINTMPKVRNKSTHILMMNWRPHPIPHLESIPVFYEHVHH